MRGFKGKRFAGMAVMSAVLIAGMVSAAHAVLQRVGPVSNLPPIGGYPAWYQDTTGLTLEFCDPKNAAEVAGGWCLLLPDNVPAPPEVFPNEFFDEHFWYSAGAVFPASPVGLLWEAAVEAAFATAVQPGDQITFSRIRMRLDPVPVTGTYTFIHPYGEEIIEATQGGRIFITDDVGINCPPGGPFNCALESRLGPFLLPSATPGGPEQPAVAGPSGLYIADPAREGPVTGSPLGPTRNFVRIEGPAGSNLDGAGNNFIQTTNFTLVGRIFTGAIPSALFIDRASYAAGGAGNKVDVFATAFPAMQGRLPAGLAPTVVTPQIQFYDAACGVNPAGDLIAPPGTPHPMSSPGLMNPPQAAPDSIYWGQSQPAAIPLAVCVEHQNSVNAGGQIVPVFFEANVTDQVFITEASYNPAGGGSLSVLATSSDEVTPPTLTVGGLGDLVNGQFLLSPLVAPPAKVRVLSSFGGSNEFQVTTGTGTPGGPTIPVAGNDTATIQEDAPVTPISVLANDTLNGVPIAGGVVTIVSPPGLGTAAVNGTAINYTPNPNANGTDGFTYTVTVVGGATSNIAAVTITITPVNDTPVAANDSFTVIAGVQTQLNVLANDTDADGQADLVAVANVTQPTPAGATVTVVNGLPLFTGAAGSYTFTYQAQDAAGTTSTNTATVTVTVAGAETVTIQLAEFRTTNREWRVSGVVTPTANGTVTIRYANGPNANLEIGTAAIGAGGAWSFRQSGVTGLRDPRTGQASQIRATGPAGGTTTATIQIRR
jgi:hypothetical protein